MNAARQIGGGIVPPAMCYHTPGGLGGAPRLPGEGAWRPVRPKTRGRCPNWWLPCITTVQDGMVVENTTSQQVMDVRKGIVEMLLINHPLDCCVRPGRRVQPAGFRLARREHHPLRGRAPTRKSTSAAHSAAHDALHPVLPLRVHRPPRPSARARRAGPRRCVIGTYIENIIDNSGNVIDVCPVGALTDKTFRFKQRVWFTAVNAHRDCATDKCNGRVTLWYKGAMLLRACNARRVRRGKGVDLQHLPLRQEAETADWTPEGPAHITALGYRPNHYELPVNQQVIADSAGKHGARVEQNLPSAAVKGSTVLATSAVSCYCV
jgi:NADH-quinone oxidoreductase subunit G